MSEHKRPPTVEEAIAEISFLIQQFNQTGAGFQEPRNLEGIIEDLLSKKITPEQALKKARKIDESKEDYH